MMRQHGRFNSETRWYPWTEEAIPSVRLPRRGAQHRRGRTTRAWGGRLLAMQPSRCWRYDGNFHQELWLSRRVHRRQQGYLVFCPYSSAVCVCVSVFVCLSVCLSASVIHFWHAPLGVHSAERMTSVSRVDDSEPHQLLHSGTGCWISGLAG